VGLTTAAQHVLRARVKKGGNFFKFFFQILQNQISKLMRFFREKFKKYQSLSVQKRSTSVCTFCFGKKFGLMPF
jgi:hypothetical protein